MAFYLIDEITGHRGPIGVISIPIYLVMIPSRGYVQLPLTGFVSGVSLSRPSGALTRDRRLLCFSAHNRSLPPPAMMRALALACALGTAASSNPSPAEHVRTPACDGAREKARAHRAPLARGPPRLFQHVSTHRLFPAVAPTWVPRRLPIGRLIHVHGFIGLCRRWPLFAADAGERAL